VRIGWSRWALIVLCAACHDRDADPAADPRPDAAVVDDLCGNGVVNLPGEVCDDGERNSDEDLHACRTDCSDRCRCSRYFDCAVAGDSYECSGECPEGYAEYNGGPNAEGYERGCELLPFPIEVVPGRGGSPIAARQATGAIYAEVDGTVEEISLIAHPPSTIDVAFAGKPAKNGEPSPWLDVRYGSNLVRLTLTDSVEMWETPVPAAVVQVGMDLTYIKASNTDPGDGFGELGLDGDTLAVGAPGEASAATEIDGEQEDDSAPGRGAVYVFRHDGAAWSQEAYIKPPDPDERFFGASVALSGDLLAVRSSAGIRLFRRDGSGWSLEATIPPDGSGYGIPQPHLSGDTVALLSGHEVRIHRADGGAWSLEATITGADAPGGFYISSSVALAGDTLVTHADKLVVDDDGVEEVIFTTLVFRRAGASWSLEESFCVDPRRCSGEVHLSPDGNRMAVPSPDDAKVHVLARAETGWVKEASIAIQVPAEGEVIALDDAHLAIRGRLATGSGTYLYERAAGEWNQVALIAHPGLMSSGGFFAHLGLRDQFLVMGATKEPSGATGIGGDPFDATAPGSGAVFVLRLP
jgi:hypothetical protein